MIYNQNEKLDLQFIVNSELEKYRIDSLYSKEPETIEWINSWTGTNLVFYDIGANIGIYSIYASMYHQNLLTYAFEPVYLNYEALCKNIDLQKNENIKPINIALSDDDKLDYLYLSDARVGNSGAQIECAISENGNFFKPMKVQNILVARVQTLVEKFKFQIPTHIKIDVDGVELKILSGLSKILKSEVLKSILVEVNSEVSTTECAKIMASNGFKENLELKNIENHSTIRRLKGGVSARNIIFDRC
jgi:FkbM family methyltransferase